MDCLYADCTPMITDCVMAELEKLGQKYRVALKIAKVGAVGCGWLGAEAGKQHWTVDGTGQVPGQHSVS